MPVTNKRRPTIHDVARASGVSRGTVSRALNGDPYVSIAALAPYLMRYPARFVSALPSVFCVGGNHLSVALPLRPGRVHASV